MTTVLMLRQGETSADADGILGGWLPDVRLTDLGIEQGESAAERLSEVRFSTLLSSPMESSRETAALVSARRRKDLPSHIEVELADCRFGEWTGRQLDIVAKEPLWEVVDRHPSAAFFPGGESIGEMQGRSVRAVRRWNRRLGAESVYVVVTHSLVIKALLADALGMHLDHLHRIEVEPGSVSVIKYLSDRSIVARINDGGGDLSMFSPARIVRPSRNRPRRSRKSAN